MAARSALASASVSPNGLTAEPALSSLPVATSRAWTAPSPLVNSIITRHRITLSPDCLPPARAYTPRFWTVSGGDVEQFETLLMKAYFNENRDGDLEKAKALVNDNPSLVFGKNGNGSTPLHLAASKGLKDLVELLLANEADANAEDGSGDTPLHLAVMAGHRDVAELLLANKARVNVTNDRGKTPLWYVTIGGTVEGSVANSARERSSPVPAMKVSGP